MFVQCLKITANCIIKIEVCLLLSSLCIVVQAGGRRSWLLFLLFLKLRLAAFIFWCSIDCLFSVTKMFYQTWSFNFTRGIWCFNILYIYCSVFISLSGIICQLKAELKVNDIRHSVSRFINILIEFVHGLRRTIIVSWLLNFLLLL